MANPIHVAVYRAMQLKRPRCPRCGHKKSAVEAVCLYCGKSTQAAEPHTQTNSWWVAKIQPAVSVPDRALNSMLQPHQ